MFFPQFPPGHGGYRGHAVPIGYSGKTGGDASFLLVKYSFEDDLSVVTCEYLQLVAFIDNIGAVAGLLLRAAGAEPEDGLG